MLSAFQQYGMSVPVSLGTCSSLASMPAASGDSVPSSRPEDIPAHPGPAWQPCHELGARGTDSSPARRVCSFIIAWCETAQPCELMLLALFGSSKDVDRTAEGQT
ncbi:hypothetical protein HaLaN_02937 [Haematococcus lacustris]|uniref:Uncharacterized protein n=1 Tax=Haematococcus lacustris TaxID=44745 RepID=A0A699YPG1_HAELA|nr:hypothetical protein HaLaN_02937 [Haematococcus lacustris]